MLSNKKITALFLIMCCSAFAQGWTPPESSPGFGASNNDAATNAPSVPIDSIVLPLLISGIFSAFILIRKKKKKGAIH